MSGTDRKRLNVIQPTNTLLLTDMPGCLSLSELFNLIKVGRLVPRGQQDEQKSSYRRASCQQVPPRHGGFSSLFRSLFCLSGQHHEPQTSNHHHHASSGALGHSRLGRCVVSFENQFRPKTIPKDLLTGPTYIND